VFFFPIETSIIDSGTFQVETRSDSYARSGVVYFQEGWQGAMPLRGLPIAFFAIFAGALRSGENGSPCSGQSRSFGIGQFQSVAALLPSRLVWKNQSVASDAGVNLILMFSAVTCIQSRPRLYTGIRSRVALQTLRHLPGGASDCCVFFGERSLPHNFGARAFSFSAPSSR